MALIAAMDNGESLISNLDPRIFFIIILVIINILLIIGFIWVIVKLIDSLEAKEKYYRNLNKKLMGK